MKYVRYDAPPSLRLRFHFRNRFGKDIEGAREFDPVTGEGIREIGETGVMVPFFEPQGYVDLDGHMNPTREVLDMVFASVQTLKSGEPQPIESSALDATIKKAEQDERLRKGLESNEPEQQPTTPEQTE
jgi:hypothetical protein